ncbi:MAG: hypothetical protein CMM62_21220, partial [Rhodospirillaceae bacterium]|nr:hypothetical protein [Rhodospirillaceae bacterium]
VGKEVNQGGHYTMPPSVCQASAEISFEATMVAIVEQRRAMAAGFETMAAAGIQISEPDQGQFVEAAKRAWPIILTDVPNADTYLSDLEAAKKAQ